MHTDTARAVDELLRGRSAGGVRRTPRGTEPVVDAGAEARKAESTPAPFSAGAVKAPVWIYPYAMSRDVVERVIRSVRLDAVCVNRPDRANLGITPGARADDNRLKHIVQATGLPVHFVKRNTTAQIRRLLQDALDVVHGADAGEVAEAVREVELPIERALADGVAVELAPRPPGIRQARHRVASRHHVVAESMGHEPQRHLVFAPARSPWCRTIKSASCERG